MPIGYGDHNNLRTSISEVMQDVQKLQEQVKHQPNGGGRELAMLYSQLRVSRGFLSEIPAEQDEIDKTSEGFGDE